MHITIYYIIYILIGNMILQYNKMYIMYLMYVILINNEM